MEAERQRQERKTVMVDFNDPKITPNSAKGAKSQTKRKTAPAASQISRQLSTPTHRPSPSPVKPQEPAEEEAFPDTMKSKMAHCLAQGHRAVPDIINEVVGADCDAAKRQSVMSCLKNVMCLHYWYNARPDAYSRIDRRGYGAHIGWIAQVDTQAWFLASCQAVPVPRFI
jgi:hypothetical protein